MSKRTFQPNNRRRHKTHGFRLRMRTRAGRSILSSPSSQGSQPPRRLRREQHGRALLQQPPDLTCALPGGRTPWPPLRRSTDGRPPAGADAERARQVPGRPRGSGFVVSKAVGPGRHPQPGQASAAPPGPRAHGRACPAVSMLVVRALPRAATASYDELAQRARPVPGQGLRRAQQIVPAKAGSAR